MPPRKRKIEDVKANTEPVPTVPPATPKNMKVTELREALVAHGLSPKGLKKELVDRLEEFLDVKVAPTPLQTVATIESPQETSAKIEQNPKSPTRARSTTKKAILEEENVDYSTEPEVMENEMAAELTQMAPNDHTEPQIAQPSTECTPKPKSELETESRPQPTFAETESRLQPTFTEKETTVVHITNFVRPFAVPAVRNLVGQFGTIVDFWMDHLRTNCFVQFEGPSAADDCIRKLGGIKWPFDTGRCLQTSKSDQKAMALAKEEGSGSRAPKLAIVEQPIVLDELFLKTSATPHLYYLPATPLE
ncbi:Aminoacyl-tRNA synthetase, class Ic domain-containing protein [Paramicrosporidium saccamoebae]|uniref:Aminoacyl-tRNA synthetase, class Ic domain-containing protein n=1 Tax=Paramicrosporidium saccamoebae TaxID=1246581 RepID=A0A2H9TQG9_9FUNG|nr:Aminoacyl-tRNA synthetase, class Ic domain-containing protein [Paramicrosporidium saccamoebae]